RDSAVLAGGAPVEDPPNFLLGATASPSAAELEEAVVNVRGKVDAGADFIQTQAVYDLDAFEEWMRLVRKEWLHEKVSILAGVLPIKSVKMARFLDEKVPGISVPRFVMERMTKSGDAKAEGIRIALETIERLREIDGIRGVHIMAVGWEDVVPTIVQKAGLHPRPI
ncbi:MAG TPA: methylenetetrahydrofolate reductase, partial [Thermoplasmata archaeon]|nr:methylenetetrahydrofolate reductase [Thermoplasmata archaeon]